MSKSLSIIMTRASRLVVKNIDQSGHSFQFHSIIEIYMAVQDGRDSALDKKDITERFGHKFYGKVGIFYSIYRLEETSQVNTRIALQISLPDM